MSKLNRRMHRMKTIELSPVVLHEAQRLVSRRLGREVPPIVALRLVLAEQVYAHSARRDPTTGAVVVRVDPDCGHLHLETEAGPYPIPLELLEEYESLGLHREDPQSATFQKIPLQ